MTEGSHASGKLLNILHLFGRLHVQDSFYLLWVRAYAVVTDDVAEQYTKWNTKDTLLLV